jgi:flagellar protein FliS
MVAQHAYDSYRQNSIMTASPEELTLMLYNGLVKYIMLARKAIGEKDIQKAHYSIIRAEDIIAEFMASLDMKYDIAHNLALLYDYMNDRLITANVKKDIGILDEVLHFAKDLRDTWAKAMKLANRDQKVAEAAK